ncbi:MAG: M56 family metallopeptidase, partial [Planctomycetota bacterium]
MSDLLLQFGLSNLLISLALAIGAWAVHRTGKRPLVAHLLWLIVLAKLVTPPILTVPVLPVLGLTTAAEMPSEHAGLAAISTDLLVADPDGATAVLDGRAAETGSVVARHRLVERGKTGLILVWVLGSVCVLAWSLVRIFRFNRLLDMASELAPPEVQRIASEIGPRLGLRAAPAIYTASAQVSPMVWWIGGRVRVLIPAALPRENAGQLRWILAHELAHIRRRDHLVRWLEWLACVSFWWNPVAWWARRYLRINEEICCDALVLSSLRPEPRTYAHSLMTVVEFLASPAIRPPAVASEIHSGGFLERRFRMIVSNTPMTRTPRWLRAFILLCAAGLLPLGMASAEIAPPETKGDERVVEKTGGSPLLEILGELVAAGAMDGKM